MEKENFSIIEALDKALKEELERKPGDNREEQPKKKRRVSSL
jgi:hypothetical protein